MNISKRQDELVIEVRLDEIETDATSTAALRGMLSFEADRRLVAFVTQHNIRWPWTIEVFDARGAQIDFFVGIWGALNAIKNGIATVKTKERMPPKHSVEWLQGGKTVVVSFGETHPRALL
jgi:hypothetical protein